MIDYSEMRKKFKAKDPKKAGRRAETRAAVKRIAREYGQKRTELGLDGPKFRRTPVYYMILILIMVMIAAAFIGVMTGSVPIGKRRISKADIQARKSIDALAQACGRYKFHVGRYPTEAEGLEELARLRPGLKGWFGPYVKKIVQDPWGHDYVYGEGGANGHPVLYSKGPDGRAGTTDDVLPEQMLFDEPFRDTTWTNRWVPYQYRGILVAPDEATKKAWQEEVKKYVANDSTPWSYPPRAWPNWELLRARAYTYEMGLAVGYPAFLAEPVTRATFRDPSGKVVTVSASYWDGVPCVRGAGWESKDASGAWVRCDVFQGREDCPPHLMGFPPVKGEPTVEDGLYTSGRETVAYVCCRAAACPVLRVGESREEALNEDPQWFEQCCRMEPTGVPGEWRSVAPLAFRYYRFAQPVESTWFVCDELQASPKCEYRTDNARRQKIWRASAETIRLCSRRFFVDAVKRDRMPWSGDNAINFLADSATYRQPEVARFTLDALGWAKSDGFLDYSCWWVVLNGLYYNLYGDLEYIASRWDVIAGRTDRLAACARADGLEVADYESVFIDWGEVGNPTTAYNVLRFGAFATAASLAERLGKKADAARWNAQAAKIRAALMATAYDAKTGLFRTDFLKPEGPVYRHANILAVLLGLVTGADARRLGDELAKDGLPGVGTTWQIGLENVALLVTGHPDVVLARIDEAWGGMVDLGFTTQFEHWWPKAEGAAAYRYYDRAFGMSLCHATSASPAYLLPRIQANDRRNPFLTPVWDMRGAKPALVE